MQWFLPNSKYFLTMSHYSCILDKTRYIWKSDNLQIQKEFKIWHTSRIQKDFKSKKISKSDTPCESTNRTQMGGLSCYSCTEFKGTARVPCPGKILKEHYCYMFQNSTWWHLFCCRKKQENWNLISGNFFRQHPQTHAFVPLQRQVSDKKRKS